MTSKACKMLRHSDCRTAMNLGYVTSCDCSCHVVDKKSQTPPTLSFDHNVAGNESIKYMLNDIGNIIGAAIKEKFPNMGFALMMFDFGEGGSFYWLSNAQRTDMIKMLREAINKLEAHG